MNLRPILPLVAAVALTACGASTPSAAPPAKPAIKPAVTAKPSPACTLPVSPSYLVRTTEPGTTATVSEVGAADLQNCKTTLSEFQATAGQADGECTTIALASSNPQINPYTQTTSGPLRDVIESAGPGC